MSQGDASSRRGIQSSWSGRAFLGIGRALYIGGASDTSLHLHHAIQVCVALCGRIRLRAGPDSAWKRYGGAVIRSDERHQLDGSGREVVIAYLEPESQEGRGLGVQRAPIQAIDPAAILAIRVSARRARSGDPGPEASVRLLEEILAQFGVQPEQRPAHIEALAEKLAGNWATMNPGDAARLGVAEGDRVQVRSPVGELEIEARLSPEIREGVIAIHPFFGHRYGTGTRASRRFPGVNVNLVHDDRVRDRFCGMPVFNGTPCRVTPVRARS